MFNEHKITCENRQSVLYLFAQSFDTNTILVKGIFEHFHEDVLLDWADDYLDSHNVSFVGDIVKIVASSIIVRELKFPTYMKKLIPLAPNKVIEFKKRG